MQASTSHAHPTASGAGTFASDASSASGTSGAALARLASAAFAGGTRAWTDAPGDCRIEGPEQISELLRRFVDADLPLSLSAPDGTVLSSCLWAEDGARGVVVFAADANDPRTERLVQCNEAVAVGYLDSVRLQFDVRGIVMVHGRDACALNAEYPQDMLRFQRRDAYRVRPLEHAQPTVHMSHPAVSDALMVLRVTDISHGGIALVGAGAPAGFQLGQLLPDAVLELDVHTQISLGLRIVRLDAPGADEQGLRLGCEMVDLSGESVRALQRYIDQTQRRRRMLAL